uniref:Uncharacterized protein n=1 Tax=Alexandrium andersonii TaxID=327968 RepID=A0A7S2GP73_9DINO|mmetsp:Transcript_57982/g.130356  ORF Transcript_57982/g.130356 Transcript_57982/m.130356 type:complete len:238 (+) Transcript_57982:114-827(+)
MSYYQGQRRFALGGKGWTVVLGSLVSLSYIRARARFESEGNDQAYHQLKGERGEKVAFADQPEVPGKREDIVLRVWRQLPEVPLPNLYLIGGCLTAIWAYRMWGTFNRLMVVRYSDIHYQLRRPDVLANKVVALKYLAVPLGVVPAGALLCWVAAWQSSPSGEKGPLQRQAAALRSLLREPCQQAGLLARDTVEPVSSELSEAPLAEFARRSQTVGRPVIGDITAAGPLPPSPAPWR